MRNLAESSESFRRVIFFPFKFLPRPHVTREKAVSCQITFKLYCFFSQFVANSSKASLSCYIYCDLRQLMVILRIVCVIYCDFAIFIAIYGNFATISSFSHDFAFYRFSSSDMGPFCHIKSRGKNIVTNLIKLQSTSFFSTHGAYL